jgi:hypothetical protein
MATTLTQKLKIGEGDLILPINAPGNYAGTLGTLPRGAAIVSKTDRATQLHWFVTNRAQLEKELKGIVRLLKDGMILWIFYPKGTSKIQTDLTRDKGWDTLLKVPNLQWLSLVAFDETWSAFASRIKSDADRQKAAKPATVREIFDWIDPEKKIVRLPEDFAGALKKNKAEDAFFNKLSFTNRKEYVEWIITAKRPETRAERVHGSIERLRKNWKNPRNL